MPNIETVLQNLTNKVVRNEREIEKLRGYRTSKFKGQKTGSNFTTTDLPHAGDYGARTDLGEIQFNIDGTVYRFASVVSGGSYAPSPHNLSSTHHSGSLADSQAPQFLKHNGTRAMTGALNMGENNINYVGLVDGLDVGLHDHGSQGGATIAHSNLSGLANDDHPQYTNDSADEIITGYWTFAEHMLVSGSHQLRFRDTNSYIYSPTDYQIEVRAGGDFRVVGDLVFVNAHTITTTSGVLTLDSAANQVYVPEELRLNDKLLFVGTRTISTSHSDLIIDPYSGTVRLDAGMSITGGARVFRTTTGKFELQASDNLVLNPDDDIIAHADITSPTWVSGLNGTGWGITTAGAADFRSIYAEELRVHSFIAEIYSALAGALVITKSRARVSRDFAIPATDASAYLYVEDLEGWEDVAVFENGDYVLLRIIDTSGGGLVVEDVYGQVHTHTDLAGGEQRWSFHTRTTGHSTSPGTIYRGSVALDYGAPGDGIWMATVLDTAGAPYSQVQTWSGLLNGEPTGFSTWVRVGNLSGLAGISDAYGLFAGTGLLDTDRYVVVSNGQVLLHNTPLEVSDGSNIVYEVDPSTPYYSLGNPAPSSYSSGAGVWAGLDSGAYKWRVGDMSGKHASWDGTDYAITGDLSAADGKVVIDDNGITIGEGTTRESAIEWSKSDGSIYTKIRGYGYPGDSYLILGVDAPNYSHMAFSVRATGVAVGITGITMISSTSAFIDFFAGGTNIVRVRSSIATVNGNFEVEQDAHLGSLGHGVLIGQSAIAPPNNGLYVVGNVSAESFTDRTPWYSGDALKALRGVSGNKRGINHRTLPSFARRSTRATGGKPQDGRDLGATVTLLTRAVQQLIDRVEELEAKIT